MQRTYTVLLIFCLFAVFLLSLTNGAMNIPLGSVIDILSAELGLHSGEGINPGHRGVLLSIRLPRTIMAIIVGGALSVSGAMMQGLFRNPLADPGLIGVSSGAALGAAIVIVLGAPVVGFGALSLPIAAFVGSVISTLVVLRLSSVGSKTVVATMLLAGIAINSIAGAATGVLVYLADDNQLRDLTFWTLGSLGGADWADVKLSLFVVAIPAACSLLLARALNIMLLGESEAYMLGLNIDRVKKLIVFLVCIIVGSSVSMTGMIGFVGLVVPHLCRLMFGPDNRKVVPASLLLGASLLLAADLASRLVVIPAELPIGIVTSMIGGPFFLFLLNLNRKRGLW